MSAEKIEKWIKNLGLEYDVLVQRDIIPSRPIKGLYSDDDRLSLRPEIGISLSFWAETKRFETLFITLIKSTPSTVVYTGELPPPYMFSMSQVDVHHLFGEPMEVKGPVRMPEPMGQTGGWESYPLDSTVYGPTKVVFQYTADMRVKTLVFTLIDKGHD